MFLWYLFDSTIGKNWVHRFLKRHPKITKKYTSHLSRSGANVTEDLLRSWFLEVESILAEEGIDLSIFGNPKRIFNFDESGFQLVPKDFKALCEQGVENVYMVSNNSDKECFTALFGCNADGDLTPPMILYPGKRISQEIVQNVPEGWSVGVSDEGWQTAKTFFENITNDFYPWLVKTGAEFPVVVFPYGHKSHINIELTEFCLNKRIILISLYPNSTRILQPLDRMFFGPFKAIWSKVLKDFLLGKSSARVTKVNFPGLLKTAVDNFTNSKSCLQKAFNLCGLCPWNVNAIDFSVLPTNVNELLEDSVETSTICDTTAEVACQTSENDYEVQLRYVEMALSAEQVLKFSDNRLKDAWYGPLEELALFNFWKLIKDKAEGLFIRSH
ncbi:uncharacterized protein LOC134209029 [Armigeres subalbatus]|uniref:uncharacterized protein LOC134209029 n=1 Tax=Armigeres subalbatus TaxID=124917 RepID=UPI002ED23CC7